MEPSPYWLAILLEDVYVEADSGRFLRNNMSIRWLNQTEDTLCYVKGDTCDKNSPKCIMAVSRGILFQREQFLVLPEENIRLSCIANGYEETGDEEQQHVEEEIHGRRDGRRDGRSVQPCRTSPKIAGCQPVWKNNPFPSQLSGTRFYNYYSFYPYVLQYLRDRNISMFV
jgi:hypothetical protein